MEKYRISYDVYVELVADDYTDARRKMDKLKHDMVKHVSENKNVVDSKVYYVSVMKEKEE